MPTAAVAGVGTTFQVGDGASPEVFATIAEVTSISGPELSAEEIEVTNLDTVGGFKEYITGLKDGGNVTLEMNWIKAANQVTLRDDVLNNQARNYKITWPTSPTTVADFNAVPSAFSKTTEAASVLSASVTLRINGNVSFS